LIVVSRKRELFLNGRKTKTEKIQIAANKTNKEQISAIKSIKQLVTYNISF